jgi:hypothetical protein
MPSTIRRLGKADFPTLLFFFTLHEAIFVFYGHCCVPWN